jgi:hypothetical protein
MRALLIIDLSGHKTNIHVTALPPNTADTETVGAGASTGAVLQAKPSLLQVTTDSDATTTLTEFEWGLTLWRPWDSLHNNNSRCWITPAIHSATRMFG